jgi:hypothetical protein
VCEPVAQAPERETEGGGEGVKTGRGRRRRLHLDGEGEREREEGREVRRSALRARGQYMGSQESKGRKGRTG